MPGFPTATMNLAESIQVWQIFDNTIIADKGPEEILLALLTRVANFCLLDRRGVYMRLTLRERSMTKWFRNY